MASSNWLYIAMNFAIVLALLGGVLYVLKRMQSGNLLGNAQRKIRVIEAISVAPRQRVVLLRVKDQDILVGVSPQQINHLASFPLTAEEVVAESTPHAPGADGANSLTPLARRLSEMLKAAQNKDPS
jgi:flagellar protein FliO/FliZ